jgi:small-conductance mechanosensitive channel
MGTEKSRSIKLATTLFGLLIFVALLWFLSKNVSLFDDMLNLRLFSSYAKNLSSKLLVALSLFFVFKILHIFIIEIALSKLRTYLVNESRFASIKKLFGFFWWLLYVVLVLSILIGNVGAFVASIGLVGLGLTFALQKPILNFVGWLTIIVKNIYSEGDRIKIGNTVGDVKEIQLMNTVLAGILENTNTRSHKIITVPNELVLTTDIQNYNKDSNYIMDELLISITYKSNYHAAMGLLDDIVSKHLKENFNSYWKRSEDYELLKNLSNLSFKRIKISENKARKRNQESGEFRGRV